jgi:hypothetical protein
MATHGMRLAMDSPHPSMTRGKQVQNDLIPPGMQPFVKLVQNNMALLTRFSMSPEAISQATANAQRVAKGEAPAVGSDLLQSNALAELMQGMIRNYTEFITELGQSGMAMLAQGQAAMMQKVQDANESVVEATHEGRRRGRSGS